MKLSALSALALVAGCGVADPVISPTAAQPATCSATSEASFAACVAGSAPLVTIDVGYLELHGPLVINRPLTLDGNEAELVNVGSGDGILITGDDVTVRDTNVRGSDADSADISGVQADRLTIDNVTLGMKPGSHYQVPATHRTQGSTLVVQTSTGLTIVRSRFGWTVESWGNVGICNVANVLFDNNFILGSSYGTQPINTLDALSIVCGSRNVTISNNVIALTDSSSGIELHTAYGVTITGNTINSSGRDGITVFDAHDVSMSGNHIVGSNRADVYVYGDGPGLSTNVTTN